MKDISLQDIFRFKRELEENVTKALEDFTDKTGLYVENIIIDITGFIGSDVVSYRVESDVKLAKRDELAVREFIEAMKNIT